MRMFNNWLGASALAALVCAGFGAPAHALSMKECSVKYKAAKADGSIGTEKWKDFRAKECGSPAMAATTPATPASAPAPMTTAKSAKPAAASMATGSAATGPATFPSVVDPKYAKEAPGKARMHTCLDQYHANKAGTGNGGLKWIQKGGGYYSQCNAKLKV